MTHHSPLSLIGSSARLVRLVAIGALAAVVPGSLAGCATDDALDDVPTGTLSVNLVGQAPSGAVYRLRDAVITVTGPGSIKVFNTEDDPSRTELSASVSTGSYSAQLRDGWRIEHVDGLSSTTVPATLLSGNPAQFTVSSEQRTSVPLRFRVTTEDIDLAQGYDIVLTTEEVSPHQLFVGEFGAVPRVTVFSTTADGDAAPLRAIAGAATTLIDARAIAVTSDQIIVADENGAAIDFFPLFANGNVAPTRRLTGNGLVRPKWLVVVGTTLWVSQFNSPLLSYSLTATGNTPPTTSTPTLIESALAFDHNELYVLSSASHDILIYSLATGVPVLVRTITDSNLIGSSSLAIAGDEIFVVQSVATQIRVYSRTASGSVSPLRFIGGDRTGFSGIDQIAAFRNELFVGDNDSVAVFPTSASGNTPPLRVIHGPHATPGSPLTVTVH
jgi:hypothetical protein